MRSRTKSRLWVANRQLAMSVRTRGRRFDGTLTYHYRRSRGCPGQLTTGVTRTPLASPRWLGLESRVKLVLALGYFCDNATCAAHGAVVLPIQKLNWRSCLGGAGGPLVCVCVCVSGHVCYGCVCFHTSFFLDVCSGRSVSGTHDCSSC